MHATTTTASCTTTTGGSPTTCPGSSSAARWPAAAYWPSSAASAPPDWWPAPPTTPAASTSSSPEDRTGWWPRWRAPGRRGRRVLGGGRRRRDPRGDGRPLPGRRLQRGQRAHRDRHRPQRHHVQLRHRVRRRRGRAADDPAQGLRPQRRGGHPADRRRGLPVALQPRRGVLALLRGGRLGELPPRGAGGRQGRVAGVHQHLPGGVRRSLAAHPLRGLRDPRRRDQRDEQAAHLAARAPRGRLHRRSTRPRATRPASATSPPPRSPATWSSRTVTHCSWRPSPAASTRATWPRSTSPSEAVGGWAGAFRPSRRRPRPGRRLTARGGAPRPRRSGRSGGTSTCRSARSGAATATSTPTPPRSSAEGVSRATYAEAAIAEIRLARQRARRRRRAGLDGVPRRRYAHPAAARRPDRDPGGAVRASSGSPRASR